MSHLTSHQPFGTPCRACLSRKRRMKFCTARCSESGPGEYDTEAPPMGAPPEPPHLHCYCEKCEYQWLEQPLGFAPETASAERPEPPTVYTLPTVSTLRVCSGVCPAAGSHPDSGGALLTELSNIRATFRCLQCGAEWQTIPEVQ